MIESRLFAGEKLLWSGAPWQGLFLMRPAEAMMIPFSLFWGGFVIFWNVNVWSMARADIVFKLFGIPFLIAGVYITVGRFVIDAWLRSKTQYAVTNQRVLIERGGLFPSRKSLDIDRLPALELNERGDGSGTIRFASSNWLANNNIGVWSAATDPTPQFLRIEHARTVYELIAKQRGRD